MSRVAVTCHTIAGSCPRVTLVITSHQPILCLCNEYDCPRNDGRGSATRSQEANIRIPREAEITEISQISVIQPNAMWLMLMTHNFWEMRSSEMSFLFGTAGSSRWVQGRHVSEVWRCLEWRVQYSEERLEEPPTRKSEYCKLHSEHGQTSLTCLVRGPPPWWHQSPIPSLSRPQPSG